MSARLLEARPSPGIDDRSRSRARTIGLTLGFVGVALATATLVNAIAAGVLAGRTGEETTVARLLAWSFGLTVTAFGTLKLGIAAILVGILVRLWMRVDSVKDSLPFLKPAGEGAAAPEIGAVQTPYGRATASAAAPKPLFIHRVATAMWAPMLAMGVVSLLAGFVLSLIQTGNIGSDPALATSQAAWVQGLRSSSVRGSSWRGSPSCSARSSAPCARAGARCRSPWVSASRRSTCRSRRRCSSA